MDFRENSKTGNKVFVGYENQKTMKVFDFDKQKGKFSLDY